MLLVRVPFPSSPPGSTRWSMLTHGEIKQCRKVQQASAPHGLPGQARQRRRRKSFSRHVQRFPGSLRTPSLRRSRICGAPLTRCTASGTRHSDAQKIPFSQRPCARVLPTAPKKIRPRQQKRGEAPKGACANHIRAAATNVAVCRCFSAAARHSRGRARLPALHRGTHHRLLPRWLSPRTGFPQSTARRCFARSPPTLFALSTLRADRSFCRSTGAPGPPGSGSHSIRARAPHPAAVFRKCPRERRPLGASGFCTGNENEDDCQAYKSQKKRRLPNLPTRGRSKACPCQSWRPSSGAPVPLSSPS
jgi:hypothetical protein